MRTLFAATAALALLSLSTAAMADGVQSQGVPSKPWGGPECLKYKVGGTVWAFGLNNTGDPAAIAMQLASQGNYPVSVKDSFAAGTFGAPTVPCDQENIATPTPALVVPE